MGDQTKLRSIDGWPRVLLFGLNNGTTMDVVRFLLARSVRPVALVLPHSAAPHLLPAGAAYRVAYPPGASHVVMATSNERDVVEWAWAAGLPVWVIRDLTDPAVAASLAGLAPEAGVVACFSRRIPPGVLGLMPLGVLNLHPSVLPDYRGPAPLFWQYRQGETQFGVTVHLLDAGLDTGPILAQQVVKLPAGINAAMTTTLLNSAGARLITEQLRLLAEGRATPTPQPDGGSYYGWPQDDDFTIPIDWTAVRAYNFMRGTEEWGRPYRVTVADQTYLLAEALAHSEGRTGEGVEFRPNGDVWLPMAEGTLWARPVKSDLSILLMAEANH